VDFYFAYWVEAHELPETGVPTTLVFERGTDGNVYLDGCQVSNKDAISMLERAVGIDPRSKSHREYARIGSRAWSSPHRCGGWNSSQKRGGL
jgi:hypothetical protein